MGNLWRLWKILFIFTRYRLDALVATDRLPLKIRILLWLAPWRLSPVPASSAAARLRLALEALGLFSLNSDRFYPHAGSDARRHCRRTEKSAGQLSDRDRTQAYRGTTRATHRQDVRRVLRKPLAPASVPGLCRAFWRNSEAGKEVVVKVVRRVSDTIERDLQLLEFMAVLLVKYSAEGRRLKPVEVVEDYRHTIYGDSTSRLRRLTQLNYVIIFRIRTTGIPEFTGNTRAIKWSASASTAFLWLTSTSCMPRTPI